MQCFIPSLIDSNTLKCCLDASDLHDATNLNRIAIGNNGMVSVDRQCIVAVVCFIGFGVGMSLRMDSSSGCSSVSIISVLSPSSGIVPQSLSRVSIHWGGFPIGTFVIVVAIGAHLVELCVEFLLDEAAQGPVLNHHTILSSI